MTKYKVGDKVILIDRNFHKYAGKMYTVVRADEYAWIDLFSLEGDAVNDYWIRPATKLDKALK